VGINEESLRFVEPEYYTENIQVGHDFYQNEKIRNMMQEVDRKVVKEMTKVAGGNPDASPADTSTFSRSSQASIAAAVAREERNKQDTQNKYVDVFKQDRDRAAG